MIKYNFSGTWRTIKNVYINVNGSWRTIGQISVKVNEAWHNIWSYSWNIGQWGNCSVSCGGGTQTRTVNCRRNDGQTVIDYLCTKYVGSKPATSQPCNTQGCVNCFGFSLTVTYYGHTCMMGGNFRTKICWNGAFITPEAGVPGHLPSYTSGGYIYTPGSFGDQLGCGGGKTSKYYALCRQSV